MCFAHICLCTVCMQCPQSLEKDMELEIWMVMNLQVGAGNQIQEPIKSSQGF